MGRMGILALAVFATLLFTPIASYASTPVTVPEPGTLTLLAVGAGAAGMIAWRRGRKK